jgi:site-specific DNA recombinase
MVRISGGGCVVRRSRYRVSSKDQEREGFSIPAQLKLLRQYGLDQGLAIVPEFVDVETAKRVGRG